MINKFFNRETRERRKKRKIVKLKNQKFFSRYLAPFAVRSSSTFYQSVGVGGRPTKLVVNSIARLHKANDK